MAPVASEEEEDLREAGLRRETMVHAWLKVETQIASLLIRHGIEGFKPRLKNAETKLCELRTFDGPVASAVPHLDRRVTGNSIRPALLKAGKLEVRVRLGRGGADDARAMWLVTRRR